MKRIKVVSLIFCLTITNYKITYCQNEGGVLNERGNPHETNFIKDEVDLSTGINAPTIPLTSISSKENTQNISLRYTGGRGIPVNEIAGPAGAGWDLNASGYIRRIVKDIPDESEATAPLSNNSYQAWLDQDYLHGWIRIHGLGPYSGMSSGLLVHEAKNQSTQGSWQYWSDALISYYRSTLLGLHYPFQPIIPDTEPDVFEFSAGGYSGSFVLDYTGDGVVLSPNQDIHITRPSEFLNSGGGNSWVITTPDGTNYFFENTTNYTESTKQWSYTGFHDNVNTWLQEEDHRELNYKSTWHLSKIEGKDGAEINFAYSNGDSLRIVDQVTMNQYRVCYEMGEFSCDCDPICFSLPSSIENKNLSNTFTIQHVKYISSIESAIEKIEFDYSTTPRTDLPNVPNQYYHYAITSIKKYVKDLIASQNILTQNIEFETDYFDYFGADGRLELKAIKRIPIGTTAQEEKYLFEYNTDENLPAYFSYQQDLYGFYNLNSVLTMIPPSGEIWCDYAGADRDPDEERTKANVLKKITLPAGGTKEFEYEQNNYWDAVTETNIITAGQRIKKITLYDGADHDKDIITEFYYRSETDPDQSSGEIKPVRKLFDISKKCANCNGPHESSLYLTVLSAPKRSDFLRDHIRYNRVEAVKEGMGKTVYEFTSHSDHGDLPPEKVMFSHAGVDEQHSWFPYTEDQESAPGAPGSDKSFERGLTKNIKQYNEAGDLLKETLFDYEFVSGDDLFASRISGTSDLLMDCNFCLVNQYNVYDETEEVYTEYYKILSDWFYLKKVTEKNYKTAPANSFVETETEQTCLNLHPDAPKELKVTQSDGRELISRTKYTTETVNLITTVPGGMTVVENHSNSVILRATESYGLINEGTTEKVISGTVTTYKLFLNNYKPYQVYQLEIDEPVSDYLPGNYLDPGAGNPITEYAMDERYKLVKTFDMYDGVGNLLQSSVADGISTSTIYGFNNSLLPLATFVNAKGTLQDCLICIANETGYVGFDDGGNDNWDYLAGALNTTEGHSGNTSLTVSYQSSSPYECIIKKFNPDDKTRKYKVSAWVKTESGFGSAQDGELRMEAFPANGNPYNVSFVPDAVASVYFNEELQWKYVEAIIDLPAVYDETDINPHPGVNAFDYISVTAINHNQTVNFLIDDIRFHPVDAFDETNTYNERRQLNMVSDVSSLPVGFFEYDEDNNRKYTFDKDHYLLNVSEYIVQDHSLSTDNNYSNNYTFKTAHSRNEFDNNQISDADYLKTISYTDGLGRAEQTVMQKFTPQERDLTGFAVYNEFGLTPKTYLSYSDETDDGAFKEDIINKQYDFYQNDPTVEHVGPFYAETVREASPLLRVQEQGAPGAAWQPGTGHTKEIFYETNAANEVLLWTVNTNGGEATSYYDEYKLIKTVTKDEDERTSITYKDFSGRTVCVKTVASTSTVNGKELTFDYTDGTASNTNYTLNTTEVTAYYVYDDMGHQKYVINNGALTAMNGNNTFVEGDAIFDENIAAAHYDKRGRVIESKMAGAGWVYMIYNTLNQPVLSQDANQRNKSPKEWTFVKYDVTGRVVESGIYHNNNDLQQMQDDMDNWTGMLWEKRDGTGAMEYTNDAFPGINSGAAPPDEIYAVNYYDNYEFDDDGLPSPTVTNSIFTVGKATGSKVKILDGGSNYLTSVNYYDDKGRIIQQMAEHHIDGFDRFTAEYDFTNSITDIERLHTKTGNDDITINLHVEYDHAKRIKSLTEQVNADPAREIAYFNYNELGQLISKKLHYDDVASAYMQNLDYRYNIRGWLKQINNSTLVPDAVNQDENDVFGEEIQYHAPDLPTGTDLTPLAQFNGNISAVKWKSKAPGTDAYTVEERAYIYRYDDMNQMTAGYFASNTLTDPLTFDDKQGWHDEELKYDLDGNVMSLKRTAPQITVIDDLSYAYNTNSHRLSAIEDAGENNPDDFHDNAHVADEYIYDANGNTIQDKNKNINIAFNYLNLPTEISDMGGAGNVVYLYDAAGNKLQTIADGKTRDYVNGIEYEDGILQYITTPEGRVRPKNPDATNTTDYVYDYFIKDHLGNVRVVLTEEEVTFDYMATMEDQNDSTEQQQFYYVPETRDDKPLTAPEDSTYTPDEKVSLLNAAEGKTVGHSKVLQMMQGDKINFDTKYFYQGSNNSSSSNTMQDLLGQLLNAFIVGFQPGALSTEQQDIIENSFTNNPNLNNFLSTVFDTTDTTGLPKAFLTWLFFDKDFNFTESSSGLLRADEPDVLGELGMLNLEAPENGFLYIYVSNESGTDVMFDNLRVGHTQGYIMEMNDYYPYGMLNKWNSFSSPTRKPINNYKYQDKELIGSLNTNIQEFGLRQYDPVTARWTVQDPMMQFMNPYIAMGNNPANIVDPSGGWCGGNGIGGGGKTGYDPSDIQRDSKGWMIGQDDGNNFFAGSYHGGSYVDFDGLKISPTMADMLHANRQNNGCSFNELNTIAVYDQGNIGYNSKDDFLAKAYGITYNYGEQSYGYWNETQTIEPFTPPADMKKDEYVWATGNFVWGVQNEWVNLSVGDVIAQDNGGAWIDNVQTGLDVAGIADPTGIVDGINALIYAGRGQWGNAGISALAMIPYVGDVGKAGRLGAKTLQFTKDQRALVAMAKDAKELGGVTLDEAKILIDWAKEYKLTFRGPEIHPNRNFNIPHIHIGPVNHIPIKP